MTTDRPPLAWSWLATKFLFGIAAASWLLVGAFTALALFLSPDYSGSIRCEPGFYPASNDAGDHRCFRNGEAPAPSFRPDDMTDHQRENAR